MTKVTGADYKELRGEFGVTEWASLLNVSRQAVYDLEASEEVAPCWALLYHYLKAHGLGILFQLKRERLAHEGR
jgi:DNA-binding XRE family transcriptional regulator